VTTRGSVPSGESTGKAQVIDEDSPHACWSGVVYLGQMEWDPESGDEAEIHHPVLCRRCFPDGLVGVSR
jgi:hypothetical protein